MDKNKFKEILTIINSNKFGRKNKIAVSKFSEIDAKKHLNTLNKIKNAEIKHKRLIPGQKELLNLFNDLSDIILTDKTLMSSKDENEKLKEEKEKLKEEKENKNENENENVNENDETLMSSNEDDETMRQNEIEKLNDHLD